MYHDRFEIRRTKYMILEFQKNAINHFIFNIGTNLRVPTYHQRFLAYVWTGLPAIVLMAL